MTAHPVLVRLVVTEDKDIVATTHWSDGTRTLSWHGLWSALQLCWRCAAHGIPTETE